MTIRILNVLMERAIGGPQLRVLQVAEGLRSEGIETIVAIPRGQGGIATLLTERGIQFHEIPHMNRIRQTWNPWTNLSVGLDLLAQRLPPHARNPPGEDPYSPPEHHREHSRGRGRQASRSQGGLAHKR